MESLRRDKGQFRAKIATRTRQSSIQEEHFGPLS